MLLLSFAGWMFWIVRKFADGDGWFEFIVRLVLDELILAIGVFAIVFFIWTVFAPSWLAPFVQWAAQHTIQVVLAVFTLLFGSVILFVVIYFVLFCLGIRF